MEANAERLKQIRRFALLASALSLMVVVISSYIRLNGAGLGCDGWPACYGQLLVGGPHPHTGVVRVLHRIVASAALLLGFLLVWRCVRPAPIQPAARIATLLLILMIGLTLAGILSSDPHRVAISFINIIGGLGLVALSWRIVLATSPDEGTTASSPPSLLLHAGLGALALTIALGALIGARYAAPACPSLPSCAGSWWPAAAGWAALNPFVMVATAAMPGEEGGVALHLLHRYCAALAMIVLGIAGTQALRLAAARKTAILLLVLLLGEFALGGLTVLSGFSLWLATGHGVGAALLLATGIRLASQSRT